MSGSRDQIRRHEESRTKAAGGAVTGRLIGKYLPLTKSHGLAEVHGFQRRCAVSIIDDILVEKQCNDTVGIVQIGTRVELEKVLAVVRPIDDLFLVLQRRNQSSVVELP